MFASIMAKLGYQLLLLIGKGIWVWAETTAKNMRRKTEQLEAKKEFDTTMAKPQATPEERAKAYEKYINSGRH